MTLLEENLRRLLQDTGMGKYIYVFLDKILKV
jgi:hypothetical protein